jgi:hypothetical protein
VARRPRSPVGKRALRTVITQDGGQRGLSEAVAAAIDLAQVVAAPEVGAQ